MTNHALCDIFSTFKRDDLSWYHRQAVRQRSATPLFPGSNPGGTSRFKSSLLKYMLVWRNGRRTGLKILSSKGRVGSTPTTSTSSFLLQAFKIKVCSIFYFDSKFLDKNFKWVVFRSKKTKFLSQNLSQVSL